jgi:hypothetical protein
MDRALYIVIFLSGLYLIDHFAFGGRVYGGTAMVVNDLAVQADYTVKGLLRPLGR